MKKNSLRLFIAVDLPDIIKDKIEAITKPFLNKINCKKVKKENFHLTLKFLGNIDINLIEKIENIMDSIEKEEIRFYFKLQDSGYFPYNRYPSVLWISLKDEMNNILKINEYLENKIEETFGIKKEKRRFVPHITIARIRKSNEKILYKVEDFLPKINKELQRIEIFEVKKIILFKSELKKEGAIYTPLYEV